MGRLGWPVLGLSMFALCGGAALAAGEADPQTAGASAATVETPCVQGKPLTFWVRALKDEDESVRTQALKALDESGPRAKEALPAVITALQDTGRVIEAAESALHSIDPEAETCLGIFRAELKSEDGRTRALGVIHLGYIAQAQPQTTTAELIGALHDKESIVRMYAADGLCELGPQAGSAVPALIDALHDERAVVRRSVAEALSKIGPTAKAAVVPLCYALRDDDGDVRSEAAAALEAFGDEARAGVPILLSNLNERDAGVRLASVYVLARFKPEAKAAVLPLCDLLLRDCSSGRRQYTAVVLAEIGPDAIAAVPALLLAMKDSDEDVREAAAAALKAIDPETADHILNPH